MEVVFSHGRSGRPDSGGVRRLSGLAKTLGCRTYSLDYTDTQDPEVRASRLSDYLNESSDHGESYRHSDGVCLVGSSMGGYASLVAAEKMPSEQLKGVFLMAPALYLPNYQQRQFSPLTCPVEIVHGWEDKVVLYEHSIRYAQQNPHCQLHLIHDDHHLSQQKHTVDDYFTAFIKKIISAT